MATSGASAPLTHPRYMPSEMNGSVTCPFLSTAMSPPVPPSSPTPVSYTHLDVPTFIEQGYAIESGKYRGLATPQNIPAEARQYLETKFAELCANPDVYKRQDDGG